MTSAFPGPDLAWIVARRSNLTPCVGWSRYQHPGGLSVLSFIPRRLAVVGGIDSVS